MAEIPPVPESEEGLRKWLTAVGERMAHDAITRCAGHRGDVDPDWITGLMAEEGEILRGSIAKTLTADYTTLGLAGVLAAAFIATHGGGVAHA